MSLAVSNRLKTIWHHPAGPKTIFFWAPACKWCLVLAGLGDLNRPADRISLPQSLSLAATGMIWSRYSLVIIPKNWNLFSVNVFVGLTGIYQAARAIKWKYEQPEINNSQTCPFQVDNSPEKVSSTATPTTHPTSS
ncbi:Mitochondrial pyruvate carrier 2 [Fragariocoptes setiger]|uniref:Mitochondrial pyruvate carrier n=1 Tax=Fragariocoptes setiger TaxID=1670756 RepID=A0ABQ7S942_9ACAR|nr:Mitochondrial pyruvate carrier 2 [Fragariocoptes setiger]